MPPALTCYRRRERELCNALVTGNYPALVFPLFDANGPAPPGNARKAPGR